MISVLTREELDFVQTMADMRMLIKTKSKKVSDLSEETVVFMGIAGEFAAAKALGCLFDPFPYRGGDGHHRDLWRDGISITLKTRHSHNPAHFLYAPRQKPNRITDDYGVVGKWIDRYTTLELVGYLTRKDMERYVSTITISNYPKPQGTQRQGIYESRLRPIDELVSKLSEVNDEEVHTAQTQGYVGYFRDRFNSRGDTVHGRDMCSSLADALFKHSSVLVD